MNLHHSFALALAVLLAGTGVAAETEGDTELDEIVVTATLRPAPVIDVPVSLTVIDARTLRDAGRSNLEDVLGLIPNLNWAGDTSLPRYFQLRGIGELEQYQGAPNPSVGFLVDDIDFSGLGTVGTLYDIDQLEVLRGPQATRYGANALAGLIYLRSADPTTSPYARVDLEGGDYNTRSEGAVVSAPVESLDSAFRLAAQHYYTDGYFHDLYLGRYDTNRENEYTLRGKWVYAPSDALKLDLTLLHIDINNGYDAFTIDNSRNTQSDQPGVDSQHSTGVSLRAHYRAAGDIGVTFIGTYANSIIKYSYDGDWGNPALWAPSAAVYEYSEIQNRDRTTKTLELRVGTESNTGFGWLAGVYANQLDESLVDTSLGWYQPSSTAADVGNDQSDTVIDSGYRARNLALFGELDGDLAPGLRASVGLRGERWSASYDGTTTNFVGNNVGYYYGPVTQVAMTGAVESDLRPANTLWGGHASLTWKLDPTQSVYATVARGYKAGGFNLSQGLLPGQLSFGPEWDLNTEIGYKADLFERRLSVTGDVFYLYRRNAQIKTSFQSDPTNPNLFVFYTGNAASGHNYGLETELAWRATERLSVSASLGLLQTYFQDFVQQGPTGGAQLPVSRELPNSPHWQAAVGAVYRSATGLFARVDVTGMGGYYFDLPPNDTSSNPYGLVNAKLGWETRRWSVYLSGRNLLDKRYPVRGFYFGDVPPDFNNELYVQLGDPRTWTASLSVRFGDSGR